MLAATLADAPPMERQHARQMSADDTSTMLATEHLPGHSRVIAAKEFVFREGDEASTIYQVEAGHVCVYRMMSDGRRQVIDFAFPGDFLGIGSIGEYSADAQATTRTRIRCIPNSTVREVVRRDPRFAMKLYEAVSRELQASRELLFTVSQRTAAERLATFLLALSRRSLNRGESATELVLPMTRTDIADFLGLTIETVSRMFTRFRNDGVIDIEQSILVTILDAETLRRIAHSDGTRPH